MAYDLVARLKLKDEMSANLRKATTQLQRTQQLADKASSALGTYRDTQGRLRSSNGRFIKDGEKSAKVLDSIGKSAKNTAGILGRLSFGKLTTLAGGIGAGAALFSSVNKAMDFEAQMSSIKALTGATNVEMAKMSELALKVGQVTKYSALEAGKGIEELLKAGLTPAQVQAGGLQNALNLATAGGLELADAAEIMSTALNAFSFQTLTAEQAANILAGTANASATSVQEMQMSLKQVAGTASQVKMRFEDVGAALGMMANMGLKGEEAGTSLKWMLNNLQPDTKDQIALFKKLGWLTKNNANVFYNASGKMKSIDNIIQTISESTKGLSDMNKQKVFEKIFGDGGRAAEFLSRGGIPALVKFRKEMSKVTALDVARIKMNNAKGAVEQFMGALETLQISALLPTMPIIKDLANAAADFVEKYTPKITKAVKEAVQTARSYLNAHFINNPQFRNLPDITSKITFVVDDFLNNGGREMLSKIGNQSVNLLADAIEAGAPRLATAGLKVGSALGDALASAAAAAVDRFLTDPLQFGVAFESRRDKNATGIMNALGLTPRPISPSEQLAKAQRTQNNMKWFDDLVGIEQKPLTAGPPWIKSHSPVSPERISYAPSSKANSTTVNIQVGNMNVQDDKDIDRVAKALAREINHYGR